MVLLWVIGVSIFIFILGILFFWEHVVTKNFFSKITDPQKSVELEKDLKQRLEKRLKKINLSDEDIFSPNKLFIKSHIRNASPFSRYFPDIFSSPDKDQPLFIMEQKMRKKLFDLKGLPPQGLIVLMSKHELIKIWVRDFWVIIYRNDKIIGKFEFEKLDLYINDDKAGRIESGISNLLSGTLRDVHEAIVWFNNKKVARISTLAGLRETNPDNKSLHLRTRKKMLCFCEIYSDELTQDMRLMILALTGFYIRNAVFIGK